MSVCYSVSLPVCSINRAHSSFFLYFRSTQTCSLSALVLGASEAAPGLFGVWHVHGPAKSCKRPVQDSVAFGARPLGRSATIALDCFCLPLTLLSFARLFARLQQIGPFGSDVLGSGSLGSASSARAASARTASDRHRRIGPPSAWPLHIGLLRFAILGSVPLGSALLGSGP
jgi:hypothetical protein